MIENFETEQKNRLVCYQNSIEKYQKLKDETSKKTDEISKIKTEIYTLKVSKFENRIVRVKNQLDNYKESEALDIRVNNFIAYYKETKKLVNSEYNAVKGLLKKALVLRKKEAKVDNKQYAEDLEKKYKEELSSLEQQLETVNAKIEEYQPKLSKEAQEKYDIILSYSRKKTLKERIFKKNNDINTSISNTVKKAEKVSLTDDATFDGYLAEQKSLKSKINKCKENYINKTKITKAEAKKMALRVMKEVGIPLPERRYKQYPFEFSGGMRQRIVIAIALTADPEILICDEPTTALDVTIQAQILELINKLKRERGLSCIFITHDLGVVANMADRVAVMYAGKVVEYGLANEIFFSPKHPYTWALLSSIPDVDSKERLEAIPGTPPDMIYPPKGDAFALRSKYAMAIDFKYEPPYFKVSDTHYAATWLLYPGAPKVEMPKIVSTRIKNALKSEEERIKKEGKEAK
ncbi:MAG: oligopeptide/dipeptide ABC transporter ATP-binding protein [Bacilli bacterium]